MYNLKQKHEHMGPILPSFVGLASRLKSTIFDFDFAFLVCVLHIFSSTRVRYKLIYILLDVGHVIHFPYVKVLFQFLYV